MDGPSSMDLPSASKIASADWPRPGVPSTPNAAARMERAPEITVMASSSDTEPETSVPPVPVPVPPVPVPVPPVLLPPVVPPVLPVPVPVPVLVPPVLPVPVPVPVPVLAPPVLFPPVLPVPGVTPVPMPSRPGMSMVMPVSPDGFSLLILPLVRSLYFASAMLRMLSICA